MFTLRTRRGVLHDQGVTPRTWHSPIGQHHVPHPLIGQNKSPQAIFLARSGPTGPVERSVPSFLPFGLSRPSATPQRPLLRPNPSSRSRGRSILVGRNPRLEIRRSRKRMMGGRALLVLLVSALLVQICASDPVSGSPEVSSSFVFVFGSVGAKFEIVYAAL
jgi:hypothetical protein